MDGSGAAPSWLVAATHNPAASNGCAVGTNRALNGSMPAILMLICLLAATGCDEKSPTAPGVPLNQEFTLKRNESATIDQSRVLIQFTEVTGDSRCPADAVCIQGGDAIVHLQVDEGSDRSNYELHTGDSSRATAAHKQLRISLVQLQPYPFSGRTIAQDDYRATLKVTDR
jgi:hypothetical protein